MKTRSIHFCKARAVHLTAGAWSKNADGHWRREDDRSKMEVLANNGALLSQISRLLKNICQNLGIGDNVKSETGGADDRR